MRPLLYDGTHGFDRAAAYFGPDPSKSFKPAGKMPDFSSRLLRFWEWPWTVKPEALGARGLMDEGLFPYRNYPMLGGVPFQSIEVQ